MIDFSEWTGRLCAFLLMASVLLGVDAILVLAMVSVFGLLGWDVPYWPAVIIALAAQLFLLSGTRREEEQESERDPVLGGRVSGDYYDD